MSAQMVNKMATELFIVVVAISVLLLSAINISNYQAPKMVLGAEIQVDSDDQFWTEFLSNNPNYIPGWIEIERMDKAREIDPNYLNP
jgi:uncharacterized membrane protein YecN with MAPEG domain